MNRTQEAALEPPSSYEALRKEVVESGCRILLSMPRTGTWFLGEFLKWHPWISGLASRGKLISPSMMYQVHIDELANGGKTISLSEARSLTRSNQTVIPLRDPVKCFLSRHQRDGVTDAGRVVREYEGLIGLRAAYVPVDGPEEARADHLRRALDWLELPESTHVDQYVREWPVINGRKKKEHPVMDRYVSWDWQAVKWKFPDLGKALSQSNLRPFLSQFYNDMAWWHG